MLIILSVFTLWLYQRNLKPTTPSLVATTSETVVAPAPVVQKPVEKAAVAESVKVEEEPESVFVEEDVAEPDEVIEIQEDEPVAVAEEPVEEEYDEEDIAPEIIGDVPARVMTSGETADETFIPSEEDVIANKPVYEPGDTSNNIFVSDQDEYVEPEYNSYDDSFYDEEEAAYQAEQNM